MAEPWLYLMLVGIRLAWTLWGQTGYIHPDEFFQSVEVVAGDILNLEVETTWEFQGPRPIRSIVLPYLINGPSLWLLGLLQRIGIFSHVTSQSIPSHLLLVAPRLSVTLIGIATELLLYRVAKKLHYAPFTVLAMYASSYVVMVYHTRTLSNTLESFLFLVLIFLTLTDGNCSKSHKSSSKGKQEKHVQCSACSVSNGNAAVVGVVITAGTFNRPTFLFFAFMPYMYWIIGSCVNTTLGHKVQILCQKVIVSGMTALYASLVFILCDTTYYSSKTGTPFFALLHRLPEANSIITHLRAMVKESVITPWNFINYNVDAKNLAEHGLHPKYLHFAVNGPMLFGFIVIFLLWDLIKLLYVCIRQGLSDQTMNARLMLVLFYMFPVGVLSIFPHQEPRFLVPLITPVTLLYANKIFGEQSNRVWSTLWILFNILGSVFFGVLHQGGLTSCMTYLQSAKDVCTSVETCPTVIFYHTYMPPRFLLANPSPNNTLNSPNTDVSNLPRINVLDFKGALQASLFQQMINKQERQVKLVAPASLHADICQFRFQREIKVENSIAWHLSMEDPPDFRNAFSANYGSRNCEETVDKSWSFQNIRAAFSLNVYTVK